MKLTIPIFRLRIGFVRSEAEKFGQVQAFIQLYIKNLTFLPVHTASLLVLFGCYIYGIHKASDSDMATMCLLKKV